MIRTIALTALFSLLASGCAVVSVADAAVTVASTTVSVGATVVETTVDVAAHNGRIPVEMIRALLTREPLARDFTTRWKFEGNVSVEDKVVCEAEFSAMIADREL